jgi:hypothetical protein
MFIPDPGSGSRSQRSTSTKAPDPDPQHWLKLYLENTYKPTCVSGHLRRHVPADCRGSFPRYSFLALFPTLAPFFSPTRYPSPRPFLCSCPERPLHHSAFLCCFLMSFLKCCYPFLCSCRGRLCPSLCSYLELARVQRPIAAACSNQLASHLVKHIFFKLLFRDFNLEVPYHKLQLNENFNILTEDIILF